MTLLEAVAAALAGVAAGAVNALAGGGTLISFPVLTALGVPPVAANVTNTVALSPGYLGGAWAQRPQLVGQEHRAWRLAVVAALGGLVGSAILLVTSDEVFGALVPLLLLLASGLLAAQDSVRRWVLRHERADVLAAGTTDVDARTSERLLPVPVFAASVYGGFFGAGLGIVLLAVLGVLIQEPLPRVNALKQVLAFIVNVTAATFFLFSGLVDWPLAVALAVGAVVGGSIGGRVAGRVRPEQLRRIVVVIGLVAAVAYAIKEWT